MLHCPGLWIVSFDDGPRGFGVQGTDHGVARRRGHDGGATSPGVKRVMLHRHRHIAAKTVHGDKLRIRIVMRRRARYRHTCQAHDHGFGCDHAETGCGGACHDHCGAIGDIADSGTDGTADPATVMRCESSGDAGGVVLDVTWPGGSGMRMDQRRYGIRIRLSRFCGNPGDGGCRAILGGCAVFGAAMEGRHCRRITGTGRGTDDWIRRCAIDETRESAMRTRGERRRTVHPQSCAQNGNLDRGHRAHARRR